MSASTRPKLFVFFGIPRSGSTFLYHTLQSHPAIFVPYRKESHYFSVNYCKGEEWFLSLYRGMSADAIGADINPVYLLDDLAIDRILEFDPSVSVILGVREPYQFALSLYTNMVTQGHPVKNLEDLVSGFEWWLAPNASVTFDLSANFLQERVAALRSAFGDDLLLFDFKYFCESPLSVVKAIESFLDLPHHFDNTNFDDVNINASGRRSSKLVNSLITNQRILDAAYAVTPDWAIRRLRRLFEEVGSRPKRRADGRVEVSAQEADRIRQLLDGDTRYYREVFKNSPIVSGSGESLEPVINPKKGETTLRVNQANTDRFD